MTRAPERGGAVGRTWIGSAVEVKDSMETVELIKMTNLVEEKRLEVHQLCGRAIDDAEQVIAR